jgi:hypothetical protein
MPTIVTVELVSKRRLGKAALGHLRDVLQPTTGIVAVAPGGYQLTITMPAEVTDGLLDAIREALETLAELLPAWTPVQVDAMTPQRQTQMLAEMPCLDLLDLLDLVDLDEVADIIGVGRQQALTMAQDAGFPAPAAVLDSGPVWRAEAVHVWATTTATGRPTRHLQAVPTRPTPHS